MYDVIVVGGGVIGGFVLRELSKYRLEVCLVEKEEDVCMGQSRANSGIVHAGFDAKEGSLKAKFNVLGNKLMPKIAEELGVKYRNNASIVVAFEEEDLNTLRELKTRGERNGVDGLEIISAEKLRELEPNISKAARGGLLAKTGGIVCPYELTIASIGNAMDNGAKLYTSFEVTSITSADGVLNVRALDGRELKARFVINCAGLGSGNVARLVGDDFTVKGRRGQYVLLDRESGDFVNHTLFHTPSAKGKGILVTQTVDNNILLGPTAEELEDGNVETTSEGLSEIAEKAKKLCENVPFFNTITSFAGTRAYSDKHDFIIEESGVTKDVFHCVGIESPGLTSAPAIAEYVVGELIGGKIDLEKKTDFNPVRKADCFFKNLSNEEKNRIIKNDPSYGRIVCRCEQITEGEIVRAIRENPPAKNVDAVKRRTRAGMGRCQGGFCQPQVAEIIARELDIPLEKVTKSGEGSYLLGGKTK